MMRERSTISMTVSSLLAVSPSGINRVSIDERPLNAVVSKPELIERLLDRFAHLILLNVGERIALDRKWPHLHMLFIDSHVESPVADIFGISIETVVLGQSVHDSGHALARRSFQAETLTGIEFEPRPLIEKQIAPIQKRRGLGQRLHPIKPFLRESARLGEADVESLVAVGARDLSGPFLHNVLDPHLFQLGIIGAAT